LNALSALVVSRGVPRLVQNTQGGSAGHRRRSVSVFRSIWRRRSARELLAHVHRPAVPALWRVDGADRAQAD